MAHDVQGGEWPLLRKQLPEGWREVARTTRAIRREVGPLSDPERLLRPVLGHAAANKSFRGVVGHARTAELCGVSDVAACKRERQCGDWLPWIVGALLADTLAASLRLSPAHRGAAAADG